jgi:hypothetical protein
MKVFCLVYVESLEIHIKSHDEMFTFTLLKRKLYE